MRGGWNTAGGWWFEVVGGRGLSPGRMSRDSDVPEMEDWGGGPSARRGAGAEAA